MPSQSSGRRATVGPRRSSSGGLAATIRQDPQRKRAHYEEALAIHRELGDRRFQGLWFLSLADLNHEEGRMEEARALFERALAFARELRDPRLEGNTLCRMAA